MAELKTKVNDASVEKFIESVKNEEKRKDSLALLELLKKTTKEQPKMWGNSIIGFGTYHYKSPSTGREGDWFVTGFFSPKTKHDGLFHARVPTPGIADERAGKI
jgi:hypothetical protein